MELMQCNKQWSTRPADERFLSLIDMQQHFNRKRALSRETVVSSRRLTVVPTEDNAGLQVFGPNGHGYAPTNWAFGQLAQLAEAPAGYLRTLPSPMAADCLNYGLQYKNGPSDVGILIERDGENSLRAATGPRYGRIWNSEVVDSLVDYFGDGMSGAFRIPGIRGQAIEQVTKGNTTLFAGDRDMFVFLADEENRIELPNRRDGKTGSLARGFFFWNSEVGAQTFGVASFLYDYVCANRIVWGAEEFKQVTIRHTASAPDKWLEEVKPALVSYTNSSTQSITAAIEDARKDRIHDVDQFLAKRFGKRAIDALQTIHYEEEGRPIETRWDVVTAVTAKARSIENQDARVEMERMAGELL